MKYGRKITRKTSLFKTLVRSNESIFNRKISQIDPEIVRNFKKFQFLTFFLQLLTNFEFTMCLRKLKMYDKEKLCCPKGLSEEIKAVC